MVPLPKIGPYLCVFLILLSASAFSQPAQKDLEKKADALFNEGRYAQAMPVYAQLLSLDPRKPEYNYKYGATALYGDPGKREDALKYLRFAVSKGNTDPRAHYFLGRAYHLNYQFADAVSAYETFAEKASRKDLNEFDIERVIETARNGQNLLNRIKDITVLDRKQGDEREFFRFYDLTDIGGKILVTPDALLSSADRKRGHRSLIHFRGAGTTVYFSSYGKDGSDGLDIYTAEVLPGGEFSEPKRLPGNINTPADEDFPFMHPDGKTFYFSSKGHSSMGGYDIFKAVYDPASGAFGSPQNMDFAVNTPDDDIFFIADSLNRLANFASGRSSAQGQLHVYRVLVDMAPAELTLVKGTFANAVNPGMRTVKITVTDAATNKTIETQYSDPATGDYLMTFPKSGRYKLSFEAQKSDRIHSGTVDIPAGDGITAYLQETELVMAGAAEKLIINNLFDQAYSGDVGALTREMLRKRAELEVNFEAADPEPAPVAEAPEDTDDVSRAFAEAGFGAGMTNQKVLSEAKARNKRFADDLSETEAKRRGAAAAAAEAAEQARALLEKAERLAAINPEEDGGKAAFEAAVAQWEAKSAQERAEVASTLESVLSEKTASLRARLDKDREDVARLEAAVESDDYEKAVAELKAEAERLKTFDKVNDRTDMTAETGTAAKAARGEADRYFERAVNLRSETERLSASRSTKAKQAEKLKGRALRDAEEELARIDEDIREGRAAAEKAFAAAEEREAAAKKAEAVAALMKETDKKPAPDPETEPQAPTPAEIAATGEEIRRFSSDRKAAEAYLLKHPEAMAALGVGNVLREFAALTGVGTLSLDEAEDIALAEARKVAGREEKPERERITVKGAEERDRPSRTAKESSAEDIADDPAKTVADPMEPMQTEEVSETAELPADDMLAETSSVTPSGTEKPREAAPSDAPESRDSRSQTARKLAEEQEALDAARDWIGIIDEAIADLEKNGADPGEDTADQLREYKRLRDEKEEEIRRRITAVEAITAQGKSSAASSAAAMADAELQTLDAAYVTRLESKINEASSTPAFTRDLNAVMPDYISALEAAEMSGKSAPEIARERIAVNERLISALAAEAENEIPAVSADRLTELRRIKALEIREDRQVAEGAAAYKPRTAEAVAYAEMIAEAEGESADRSKPAIKSDLSPELEESLRKPYSWDDVVPGYIDMMADDTEDIDDPEDLAFRISAHKTMLTKIKEDIDLFRVLASEGKTSEDPRVKQRYEQLLSERSVIADVLAADEAALREKQTAVTEPQAEPLTAQTTSATGKEALEARMAETVRATDSFTDSIAAASDRLYAVVGEESRPASERLRSLAAANLEWAEEIEVKTAALTAALDRSVDDDERDMLQVQIQKLDALMADKLQEADRLAVEADEAGMFAETADVLPAPAEEEDSTADKAVPEADLPEFLSLEDLQIASAPSVQLEDFSFRSLQANMNGAKLDSAVETAKAKRQRAAELLEAYADSEDIRERAEIFTELEKISREVRRADINLNKTVKAANAAETDFHESALRSSIGRIKEVDLSAEESERLESIREERERLTEAVESNRQQRDELDAYDTRAYSIMLREESELIAQLQDLSADAEQLLTAAEVRAAEQTDAQASEIADTLTEVPSREDAETVREDLALAEADSAADALDVQEPSAAPDSREASTAEPHAALPGKTYMTPALQKAASRITDEDREAAARREPALRTKLDFVSVSGADRESEFLAETIAVDRLGLDLLRDASDRRAYLVNAVIADSLKKIETANAAIAKREYTLAREREAEAERLLQTAESESSARSRESVRARADRIAAEAEVAYRTASQAAERAEFVRAERRRQEDALAEKVRALGPGQVAGLNKLLKSDAYTVVTADLALTEEEEQAPEARPEPEVPAEVPAQPLPEPVPAVPQAPAPERPVTSSGNWLAMVEVIAEKTDFSDVDETMFVMAEGPVYSAEKPIPVDPVMPKGLIFQVQVGAFRNEIPQDHFGEIVPVMGQKLDNGITRYRAGLFKSYGAATEARDVIRGMGYRDAFVVAYVDGERLTGAQARDILAQARTAEAEEQPAAAGEVSALPAPAAPAPAAPAAASTETASTEEMPQVPDYYDDPEAAEAVQVEAVRGLFYTVQVGVYSKPTPLGRLYNLSDLNSELTSSGLIRYTTGRYSSVASASQGKSTAVAAGVEDAFVTAYYNGRRISLAEAQAVAEREGPGVFELDTLRRPSATQQTNREAVEDAGVSEASDDGTNYIIIIGQFGADVPQNVAEFLLGEDAEGIRQIAGPRGGAMYISPEFSTRAEAEDFLRRARAAGLVTAIMGTVIDGEIKALENR